MSSIKDLDTFSLRQLYYLLSIDMRYKLTDNLSNVEYDSRMLAKQLCNSAFVNFGIELNENEIIKLFIQPIADYMEPLNRSNCTQVQGEYALSIYHLEFRSALALFLSGLAKK